MARGDAGQAAEPFLLYRDGEGKEWLFTLAAGLASVSVGRGPSPDLALDWDQQVSRLHARLERADGGWAVVDDGLSRNGTFVNGERVSGRQRPERRRRPAVRRHHDDLPRPRPRRSKQLAASGEGQTGVVLSTTQRRVLRGAVPALQGRERSPSPPTDQQLAEELFLPVEVVKTHLRVLFAKFGVDGLAQDQKRAGLVERAFADGVFSERDL